MGNESFINAVSDTYSVEEIMDILGIDEEYVIHHFLKALILRNKNKFEDIIDMED